MIIVKGLQKKFENFYALKNVDMHVKKGEIYGFIGPNGSGKTTTMNILAGLSRPAQGECTVNGLDVTMLTHPGDLKIGYLPEEPKFYPWMTAHETLDYLSETRNAARTKEILRWTGLLDAQNRRVGGFSRGMKQRLGIGVALIRNPQLLILDEPSSALDPEGRSEVLRLIKDLNRRYSYFIWRAATRKLCVITLLPDNVGCFIERPIPAGFLTLVTAFGIHFISSLLRFGKWTPSGLLVEAQKLMPSVTPSLLIQIAVTVLLIVFMTPLTLLRLRQLEWNERAER